MNRRLFHPFVASLLLLLAVRQPALLGQATPGSSTNAPAGVATNAPAAGTGASAETPVEPGEAVDPESRELRVRDILRYRVHQDPSGGIESMRITITDSGEALFNVTRNDSAYITVKAAGRRLAEVRAELKEKLDADYYRDSTIDLSLEAIAANNAAAAAGANAALANLPKVVVHGEYHGTYLIPEGGKLMLSEIMIQMPASPTANRRKVQIQRVGPDGRPLPIIEVNVDQLLLKFDPSKDVELKDGDRIFVPRRVLFGF